jgi:hypothetical protein
MSEDEAVIHTASGDPFEFAKKMLDHFSPASAACVVIGDEGAAHSTEGHVAELLELIPAGEADLIGAASTCTVAAVMDDGSVIFRKARVVLIASLHKTWTHLTYLDDGTEIELDVAGVGPLADLIAAKLHRGDPHRDLIEGNG